MIEVEKKFIMTEQDKDLLTQNAQFLNERVFTDIYYDTDNFSLTTQDKWLRARENRFELKVPLHQETERLADQYDEIESEEKIRQILNFPSDGGLATDLEKNGYLSFCICKTTRRKYRNGLFILDLDTVDFQNFTYNIGEIELMINDKSEIQNAIERILSFAREKNLMIAPVRGKVIEYLKRIKSKHYQALVRAGVVKDF